MNPKATRPNPLTDPVVPALCSMALITAEQLGIFEAIQSGCHLSNDIAKLRGVDAAGVERVADVLVSCGYLSKTENKYKLTEVSQATLVSNGELDLRNWAKFSYWQIMAAVQMEQVILTRERVDLFKLMESDDDLLIHQRAMAETAKPMAEWIAQQVTPSSDATRMVDIGGSHGVYSAALCRRHSAMRSTIYELPAMVDFARTVSE